MRTSTWIQKNTHSLAGKTVAISGSTGGLGKELCAHLAGLGADLILLDRNTERSLALAAELHCRFPAQSFCHLRMDLEDMDTVRATAEELACRPPDYLILNAGAYKIPRHKCATGYDNVFQINFIAPYYLARTLLPHLRKRNGKVIAVGSIAHNYSPSDPADVDFSSRTKASLVYGNAKRYLTAALWELSRTENEIAVTHPGITLTGITAHYPPLLFAIIKHPMKVIFMSPRRASLSILSGLFTDCGKGQWIGPRFFHIWGLPKRSKLFTISPEESERICRVADQIYHNL